MFKHNQTLVGPQLRQLRRSCKHTQAEMARQLGASPAYINLLENNQRSLSVKVLLRLTEAYGVDWRKLVNARGMAAELLVSSPESTIHDFFRDHSNHLASLENTADSAREAIGGRPDDLCSNLKRHLDNAYGITVRMVGLDEMSDTPRIFEAEKDGYCCRRR